MFPFVWLPAEVTMVRCAGRGEPWEVYVTNPGLPEMVVLRFPLDPGFRPGQKVNICVGAQEEVAAGKRAEFWCRSTGNVDAPI